jgi:CTP synthase
MPDDVRKRLLKFDGILVAPGFGERGIEGKIEAVRFVREMKIPFFGICLGMQCAAVEFAKNILKLKDAASTETHPKTSNDIIHLMPDQIKITAKGGTMRLGSYKCKIQKGSLAQKIYGKNLIEERHRHRYEFNSNYIDIFEKNGLKCTGINPETNLVEIIELENHPYFIGVQFHPELKSTVEAPHPLFISFVKAAIDYKKSKT